MRGGAVWQLVGLITRRSQVQILPPLPNEEWPPCGAIFIWKLARFERAEKQVQPQAPRCIASAKAPRPREAPNPAPLNASSCSLGTVAGAVPNLIIRYSSGFSHVRCAIGAYSEILNHHEACMVTGANTVFIESKLSGVGGPCRDASDARGVGAHKDAITSGNRCRVDHRKDCGH